jgi:hypothetical protein
MRKNYNKILIIFSLIIFLYYILNSKIIHEGLNYDEMSKEQKKDQEKKFKDAKNNFKWIKDKGYKLFKASGGMYSDYENYENILLKGSPKKISSEDLLKVYNSVNNRRKIIEDHEKKFKDARNNYEWMKDEGYKIFVAIGGKYDDWKKYEDILLKGKAKDISSEELSKIYTGVNQSRKKIEDHKKKFKDAKNNYEYMKDKGGYKTYKAAGGMYNDWKLIEDTFKGKGAKDVSSEELSKVYPIVNEGREKVEEYKKTHKTCPSTKSKCFWKNIGAMFDNLGRVVTNSAKLVVDVPKLAIDTASLFT